MTEGDKEKLRESGITADIVRQMMGSNIITPEIKLEELAIELKDFKVEYYRSNLGKKKNKSWERKKFYE